MKLIIVIKTVHVYISFPVKKGGGRSLCMCVVECKDYRSQWRLPSKGRQWAARGLVETNGIKVTGTVVDWVSTECKNVENTCATCVSREYLLHYVLKAERGIRVSELLSTKIPSCWVLKFAKRTLTLNPVLPWSYFITLCWYPSCLSNTITYSYSVPLFPSIWLL
jgi:hypothetical protein